MIAPTVGPSTAPETNTVSAKLGFDAGMRHAAVAGADAGAKEAVAGAGKVFLDMAGAAAIEGAEAGFKRFEPTILLSVGACILTAAFFVPPTAASGAEVVVGFVGLCFMCDGFIGKNALRAKDAAKDAAAKDAAEAAAKDATKATAHDKQGWWAPRKMRPL